MDVSRLETLVILGVSAMLVLTSGIIFFIVTYQKKIALINKQKEKELIEAAINAEEEERMRIAAELHDDIGAMLASVKLNFHQAEEDGAGSEAFLQSHKLMDETIAKIRSMSRSLQPVMMEQLGLPVTLRAFFDMFALTKIIKIHYTATPLPEITGNIGLGVYRIIQELVTNTLKHAHASDIWFLHVVNRNNVQFTFTHNGWGITNELFERYIYKKDSTGLKNIVNRIKVINGNISFENDNGLYHVNLVIPL